MNYVEDNEMRKIQLMNEKRVDKNEEKYIIKCHVNCKAQTLKEIQDTDKALEVEE